MYMMPNKVMLGERLISGALSTTLSVGMVLALTSLSGITPVPEKVSAVMSTFDLAATSPGKKGSETPQQSAAPPKSEAPPPPPLQPEPPAPLQAKAEPPKLAESDRQLAVQEPAGEPARPSQETAMSEARAKPEPQPQPQPQAQAQTQKVAARQADSPAVQRSGGDSSYKAQVWQHLLRYRRSNVVGPGSAFIDFLIKGDGYVADLGIVKSSGSKRFDGEAMQMVRRAQPFPRPPHGMIRAFTFEIKGG
ncbi:MAG: cell envelope integrity protein TolA [Sphingobium sp.]